MREMKDSGIEWIGEIPINWDIAQFKKILIRNDGGLWGNDPSGQDDILVLRSTEQTIDGKWDIQSPAYRDLSNVSNVQEYLVKCGDLLITKSSGSDLHIGKTTIVDELIESLHCSFSNFIQRLRVCSKMNPRYYWYILNSSIARGQFVYLQNSTSGIGNINSKNINEIEVPIPPLDIQHTIVDYLDRKCSQIDTIIARQQEVIEKLKAYKLSVITEAVTKGLNPDVPMKDSRVEWIGEVPGNWTKVKLKNICQFINGDRSSNYPSPNEYVDNGIPFLGADSLCGRYVDVTQSKKITKEKYHSMGGAKIQKGDILYTLRGSTIGKNAIATFDEGTVASSLMVIRPISLIPGYLLYWLNSEEEFQQRQSYINGSTAPNLSAENVGSFVMFLPPALEQRKIADYLDTKCAEIELTMLKKQVLIDQLGNYKKSLIYEVVTGKKEV